MLFLARAQEAGKIIRSQDLRHRRRPSHPADGTGGSVSGQHCSRHRRGPARAVLRDRRMTVMWRSDVLREAITFAPQNLLQDPPFSRLDLISCRNLLIYLEPEVQRKVLALFHFSLRDGGHLFLGPRRERVRTGGLVPAGVEEMADLPPDRTDAPRHRGFPARSRRRVDCRARERPGGFSPRAASRPVSAHPARALRTGMRC